MRDGCNTTIMYQQTFCPEGTGTSEHDISIKQRIKSSKGAVYAEVCLSVQFEDVISY